MPCNARAQTGAEYPITLVVAFIDIGGSANKRPQDYDAWIANLAPHVKWPLVVFGDPASLDKIKRLRGDKPAAYFPAGVEDLYGNRHAAAFRRQARGRGRGCERIEKAALRAMILCEKPFFLERAARANPFNSPLMFWCDIAALRPDRLCGARGLFQLSEAVEWPNLAVCRQTCADKIGLIGNRMTRAHALKTARFHTATKHRHALWVGGLFFGGPTARAGEFADAYRQAHDARAALPHGLLIDEPILRDVYANRPDLARVLRIDRITWLRCLTFPHPPLQFWWFLLNGRRFPWRYFRRHLTPAKVCAILATGVKLRFKKMFRRL